MADVPPQKPVGATGSFRFTAAVGDTGESSAGRKGATFAFSMVFHSIIAVGIVIVPILAADILPTPSDSVLKAFFVTPGEMAPPPPPPPPPAPGPKAPPRTTPPPVTNDSSFVAPIDTPAEIKPEEADFGPGIEGGVAGGVEGGVPGGVVGGIVGGMPTEAPPPPKTFVRVGGNVKAPKKIKSVIPPYPEIARTSRISAVIVVDAEVDTRGMVTAVRVIRGHPLFDQAVEDAIKQWRYQPLLLNGEPTPFIVQVTLPFSLSGG